MELKLLPMSSDLHIWRALRLYTRFPRVSVPFSPVLQFVFPISPEGAMLLYGR